MKYIFHHCYVLPLIGKTCKRYFVFLHNYCHVLAICHHHHYAHCFMFSLLGDHRVTFLGIYEYTIMNPTTSHQLFLIMETNQACKCIICWTGSRLTNLRLKPSSNSLEKIKEYAHKWASFRETQFAPLCDRIESLPEDEYFRSMYYSTCYKNIVHTEKFKTAEKRFHEASSSKPLFPPKKDRPSKLPSCNLDLQERHLKVPFLKTKKGNAPDEKVRISLAHVNHPSDCAAFDTVYHRNCLRDQERKIQQAITNTTTSLIY